jgi:hypothetical protein
LFDLHENYWPTARERLDRAIDDLELVAFNVDLDNTDWSKPLGV